MTRPPPDPREQGFRLSWLSHALMWSAATRRLFATNQGSEIQLAFVSFHLCLKCMLQLVAGTSIVRVDPMIRDDSPYDKKALRKLLDRVQGFRDEILHHAEKVDEGRGWELTWAAGALTLTSSVGRHEIRRDSMTREDVFKVLDAVDPWLGTHYRRLRDASER